MLIQTKGYILQLRVLDTPEELDAIEEIQRHVWPGDNTEVVPTHMLLAAAHNGGLVIGAYLIQHQPIPTHEFKELETSPEIVIPVNPPMVGFVFGFPGFYSTPDGPRLKHCSHMLGVLPDLRDAGIGYALKRAQWQLVRHMGIDRITWTYDPLQSRNAHLNIARLGAVCNTYIRDAYGQMRDELNIGISSDRFQVDWWVNSKRVNKRLSRHARQRLDLAHFLAAGIQIINPSQIGDKDLSYPAKEYPEELLDESDWRFEEHNLILVEIPANIQAIKDQDMHLAQDWRLHTRGWFEALFHHGYFVTDFVHLPGKMARSFYVLTHGDSTL